MWRHKKYKEIALILIINTHKILIEWSCEGKSNEVKKSKVFKSLQNIKFHICVIGAVVFDYNSVI